MPIELISVFYFDEKLSHWLIDSGATKHMCHHDKSAFKFDQGTFQRVSGVKTSNGSVADILGTGTVTITRCVNKRLQTLKLFLMDVYLVPDLSLDGNQLKNIEHSTMQLFK